jgi:hypothetical protein
VTNILAVIERIDLLLRATGRPTAPLSPLTRTTIGEIDTTPTTGVTPTVGVMRTAGVTEQPG